jgi:transcriptional/translational regulatory protein YebC/TACO1
VRDTLEDAGYELEDARMVYEPTNPVALDETTTIQVMKVIDQIEDLDDVQNLYSALEITDEAIAAVEGSA